MAGVPVSVMSATWKGLIAAGVKHVGAAEHNAIIAALAPCFTPDYLGGINGWPLSPIGDTVDDTFDTDIVLERIKAIDWDGAVRGAPGEPLPTTAELAAREALVGVLADHGYSVERDDETGRLYTQRAE